MSKKMASVLIAYGGVLVGLNLVLQNFAAVIGEITCIVGIGGGAICLFWGLAALAGLKGRAWAILTTIAVAFVSLNETVNAWVDSAAEGSGCLTVRLLATTLFLLTISMLIYLLHGERPPKFYQTGGTRRDDPASSRNEAQSRDERSHR
jgi:hypothetical protein